MNQSVANLFLCVEVDALLAVEVGVPEEGGAGPSERHHWQWHRDGHIHANLKEEEKNGKKI